MKATKKIARVGRILLATALGVTAAFMFVPVHVYAQTAVDTAVQNTVVDWGTVLSGLPVWVKVTTVAGFVSEILPFIPVPANGILHTLFLGLKAVVNGIQGKKA